MFVNRQQMTSVFGNRKTQYAKPDDASTSREERMTRLKFEVQLT
jgi:hypothetical protein